METRDDLVADHHPSLIKKTLGTEDDLCSTIPDPLGPANDLRSATVDPTLSMSLLSR